MDSSTTLPASSILPGCILWLTDPERGRYSGPYSHSDPDEDEDEDSSFFERRTMYGHPVMVLQDMGKDVVAVCILTTLNGQNIRTNKRSGDHESYLAIYPKEPPCVDLYPQLCLKNSETLRKPGYLCIREKHSVHRSKLELYDRNRPAGFYKLSPLSYAIVANTFQMNIPIPQGLTPSEKYRGMCIPIAGPQSPGTARALIADVEASNTPEKTQPPVQAPQDRKAVDHVSASTDISADEGRTTEETSSTSASPTPTEAERPDEISVLHKVPFYMVPSAFVSLMMRMMGTKGASAKLKTDE